MLKVYEQELRLSAPDVDLDGKWRMSSIFLWMQEASTAHARELHMGRFDLLEKNIIWVLTRMSVQMLEYPELYQKIRIKTWPQHPDSVLFGRYYTYEDAQGKQLGGAASAWVLVNTVTRRIVRPHETEFDFPDTGDIPAPLPMPTKLRFDGAPTKILQKTPVYSDFDVNGHVNNARYIEWICDLFQPKKFCSQRLQSVNISYSSEVLPGEEIRMELCENEKDFFVRGKKAVTGALAFEAKGQFAGF